MTVQVEFPGRRIEVIESIKDLSDFEMQKRKWVDPTHPCRFSAKLTYPIDVLLDEHDLDQSNWSSNIGWILRDEKEGQKVHEAAKALMRVIREIGNDQPDSTYIDYPLWADVVSKAKVAYEVLMDGEDLDDLLRQRGHDSVD